MLTSEQQTTVTTVRRQAQVPPLKMDREMRNILDALAKHEDLSFKATAKRIFKEAARKRKIVIGGGSA